MWQMNKMMWISRKLTFPLDINSFLWQGCTFRAQSNSLRGFDGYGETGKHHLSLGKASQSTRRAPLWSHNCRRCHLSGSLHDGSPSPSGDVQIASEALNFSPEPEFRSLFLVYFRNKIREGKWQSWAAFCTGTLPPKSARNCVRFTWFICLRAEFYDKNHLVCFQ